MGKVISTLTVFIFIYPIFLRFLPIPTDRILQIMGLCALFLNQYDLKLLFISRPIWQYINATLFLLILVLFAQLQTDGSYDFYLFKVVLDTLLSFFSAYFVYLVLRKFNKEINIYTVFYYLVLAAILQTIVSSVFFTNPSFFETYTSFLREDTNEGLFSRVSTLEKRFIGLGSQFFSGVTRYGFAFLAVLILPYIHRSKFTSNKLIYWSSVILILIGGVLTGRTFFVAVFLGILMVSFVNAKSIFSFITSNIKVVLMSVLAIPVMYYLATLFLDAERLNVVNDYVFELFINFLSEGELSTTSSDATLAMYKFPDNLQTWLFGDGKMNAESGGYYMKTDVGYIRLIFYFGLICTLAFIFILFRYYKILSSIIIHRGLNIFFLFCVFWILILNFKGLAFESQYLSLFLLTLVLAYKKDYRFSSKKMI